MSKNQFRYLNIYYWIRKLSSYSLFQKIFFLNESYKRKVVFNSIYKSNHWRDYFKPSKDQSASGLGSDLNRCDQLIISFKDFIQKNKVKSILDLACGDFNWMKEIIINNKNIELYLGIDIVDEIIEKNNEKYSNSIINFKNLDVLNIDLPKDFDLIIARDFFIHIKNDDILNIIKRIKYSNSNFFAVNNFSKVRINRDLNSFGKHRDINFEIPPFNLINPIASFVDNDRKLNVYNLKQL